MFDNFKIRTKIDILAGIMMIFIVLIGGVGYHNLTKANKDMKEMYEGALTAIEILKENKAQARAVEADIYSIILNADNPQEQKNRMEDIDKRAKIFNDKFQKYKSGYLFPFELDIIPKLEENLKIYREGREKVLALAMEGNMEEAKLEYNKIKDVAEAFQKNLEELSDFNVKAAEELSSKNNIDYVNTMKSFLSIIVIAGIFSIVAAWFISKIIRVPIRIAINHIEEVADYNISKDMSSIFMNRKDEVGDLARAVQKIEENLRSLLKSIAATSDHVVSSSEELTATSQQAATAAEEVAKTIEEIAKGATDQAQNTTEGSHELMELGNLIEEDQKNVEILNETSNKVNELVGQGLDIMNKLSLKTEESSDATNSVYESIKKTNESSEKINEASNLIASIAQQTNLLALNAAIEAARAGEYGKGFSVVAEEIRKLAEQSTESTRIIDDMVKNLQQDSKEAVKIMERLEIILKEQIENVNLTENKYKEISYAMKKSAEAVNTINETSILVEEKKNEMLDTIQNLSSIAQENAAGTQEAAASIQEQTASIDAIANSSEGLSYLSQELQDLIAKFKM